MTDNLKMKVKKAKSMKTSELMDELGTDLTDERWSELDDELEDRYPINTILETIKGLEEEIKELTRLNKHQHSKEGKVLYEN